jgi:CII-binding regulator of phage lambda lysogenization HflD
VLDYPCKPDLDAAAVDAAAAALRSDPQALRLLRRRLADVETQLSDLGRNNGNLLRGLAVIGKEAP